jgi:hypothetical protein
MTDESPNGANMSAKSVTQLMSKRTTITLPDSVFDDLERWADEEGRPTANLAAFLVETCVKQRYPDKYQTGKLGPGQQGK